MVIVNIITEVTKKYSILSKDEAISRIIDNSDLFFKNLEEYLKLMKIEKVNFVGIGNSLSAGWSAIDQDVRPFILKLQEIMKDQIIKKGFDISFYNYALAANNSNEKILNFLQGNPTEKDVKHHFINDVNQWKKKFDNTLLENYIDLNKALDFYPNSNTAFKNVYCDNILTFTLLNSCTGGFLESLKKKKLKDMKDSFKKDKEYLVSIIDYLKQLKKENINLISVGNFPYISTSSGVLINKLIDYLINDDIQKICLNNNVTYFNKNQIALFQKYKNPHTIAYGIKVDNHPRMDEQYTVLYYYFNSVTEMLETKKKLLIR